jgi:transposase
MLANAAGIMPDSLKFEADRQFFERELDGVDVVVHGRHPHEQQPRSYLRHRLILTRQVPSIAADSSNEKALFWNPAGASFQQTTESGGPRGYDAAKKIKGRKRHIVTDTTGLMVGAAIHPADVQDRDGAPLVIEAIHDLFPWLRHLFADSAYSGDKLLEALAKFGRWSIEIVRRMADTVGFEVLPRRWVVERTLAWLNRNRRLAKDFEASIESRPGGEIGEERGGFRRSLDALAPSIVVT